MPATSSTDPIVPPAPTQVLSGLLVSGFLLALPGGLLPLWDYHRRADFSLAATYFLLMGVGIVCGAVGSFRLRHRAPPHTILAGGCFVGSVALLLLSVAAPPAPLWFQLLGLLLSGTAASTISTAVFESLAAAYETDRAGIVLRGGIYFGAGSVLAAWLLAQCLGDANPVQILALTAMLPAAAGIVFARQKLIPIEILNELPVTQALTDLRSMLAIFFAMLLFFQFAIEWSIAGWLPIFLIDRLGISPSGAVMLLALYWLSLTVGRAIASHLLGRVSHTRLLGTSASCALFGCVALLLAGTTFGVVVAILFIGAGFSSIYPLAAERISTRFSYYHPGYFNGIFTFAMLGGILAPFVVGQAAAAWGLKVIPLAAIAGSCAVFVLILLISLGRKVSGS